MHALPPNFQEDMQFPKVIVVKPDSPNLWSKTAPINSEKIQTELNSPQSTGVRKFKLSN
jgi:hypothetical protein